MSVEAIIYIKADIHTVVSRPNVLVKDICEIGAEDHNLEKSVGELSIYQFQEEGKQRAVLSVVDLVRRINQRFPKILISNEGETDFIIEYIPVHKSHPIWEMLKIGFVSLAIFFGSAFSIMTFNEDVSAKDVLYLFYALIYPSNDGPRGLLEVCYCIGLPLGILLFFNHFSSKKKVGDPTPLQIQIHLFEENESKASIEYLKKNGEKSEEL